MRLLSIGSCEDLSLVERKSSNLSWDTFSINIYAFDYALYCIFILTTRDFEEYYVYSNLGLNI